MKDMNFIRFKGDYSSKSRNFGPNPKGKQTYTIIINPKIPRI